MNQVVSQLFKAIIDLDFRAEGASVNWPHVLGEAWNYKLSLLPVLVTYFIFELPALVRKYFRWLYTPIYFVFFPLGHTDQLYAQYFNEDDFYNVGVSQTEVEKAALRKRIVAISILSMIISTVVAPWITGFVAALYLTKNQFSEFVAFLIIVKAVTLIYSIVQLRYVSFIYASKSLYLVFALYALYVALVYWGITNSYDWTSEHMGSVGLLAMLWKLAHYFYAEWFFSIGIVSAATWAITYHYTKPGYIPER